MRWMGRLIWDSEIPPRWFPSFAFLRNWARDCEYISWDWTNRPASWWPSLCSLGECTSNRIDSIWKSCTSCRKILRKWGGTFRSCFECICSLDIDYLKRKSGKKFYFLFRKNKKNRRHTHRHPKIYTKMEQEKLKQYKQNKKKKIFIVEHERIFSSFFFKLQIEFNRWIGQKVKRKKKSHADPLSFDSDFYLKQ